MMLLLLVVTLPIFHCVVTIPEQQVKPVPDAKPLIITRFKSLISDFLTDAQLSKAIDISAVGMHKGHKVEKILDDLSTFLKKNLTTAQLSDLVKARKGVKLDHETLDLMESRIERIIIYSVDPAAEQIHLHATRPSLAFSLMAQTLNERFVNSVKSLIHDILSEKEYEELTKNFSPKIVKL